MFPCQENNFRPETREFYESVIERASPHTSLIHGKISNIVFIGRPDITQVESGMMVQCWVGRGGSSRKTWGIMIHKVDIEKQQVLVGEYIGGTKEYAAWVDIDQVKQVWTPGDLSRTYQLIADFGAAVGNAHEENNT